MMFHPRLLVGWKTFSRATKMAKITNDQLKRMLDSGLTISEVRQAATSAGDTIPEPSFLGTLAQPVVTAGARFGQAIGAGVASALGKAPVVKSQVFEAPLLGSIPIPAQQAITSPRGVHQILGQTVETAGMLAPVGRIAKTVAPALGKTLGLAAGLGASGYGVETGVNLQEGAENPFSVGFGTLIPAAIPIVGKALSAGVPATAKALRFATAKASGLTPDEISTIITKPNEFVAARAQALDRFTIANQVEQRFSALKKEASEIGAGYNPIRESGTVFKFDKNPFDEVLGKYKIGLENGKLSLSKESPALSGGDVAAVERVFSQYGFDNELTPNAFLNLRSALDDLANWGRDPLRTKNSESIFRDLRTAYDDIGKAKIPKLKETDEAFAPVRKEIASLEKDFIEYKDGRWALKDTAINKINNATNKGRDKVLDRLEKYVPGITQQIQLVKALEGIEAASGNRVGAYAQSLLVGGGLFSVGVNPAFALIGLAMAMPEVMVPILVQFGKLRGFSSEVIRSLAGKLVAGKTLTERELLIYKNAILEHLNKISPGDQFLDSPLGQRASAYHREIGAIPGLSMKDVSKDGFQGFTDLSTKLLEKLKGRTTVSRQFIEDLSNSPDLKQPERDLIRRVLGEDGETIYHGTPYKFDDFKKRVTFFTPDKKFAENYASEKSFANQLDAEPIIKERKIGNAKLFDPSDKAQLKQLEERLPENIDIIGAMGMPRTVSKSDYVQMLGGKARIEPRKEYLNRKVGDVFFDTASGDTIKVTKVNPDSIEGMMVTIEDGAYKSPKWMKEPRIVNIPTKEYVADMSETWRVFEGGDTLKTIESLGYDGVSMGERGSKTYALFDPTKLKSDQISVPDFANKVKSELLPLKAMEAPYKPKTPKWERVVLPDELRGPVANYDEHIYNSPIKTSAGEHHFPSYTDSYFAHTRIEDLPAEMRYKSPETSGMGRLSREQMEAFENAEKDANKRGTTRRVIEIQSDLFQKGRLEGEMPRTEGIIEQILELQKQGKTKEEVDALLNISNNPRAKEIAKLEPYRNTWHERVIREEVKQAAKDGKTKLQFPTGETAMKIEGLGDDAVDFRVDGRIVEPANLKVGDTGEFNRGFEGDGEEWVVTEVLENGKFKAFPKNKLESVDTEQELYDTLNNSSQWTLAKQDDVVYRAMDDIFDGKADGPDALFAKYDFDDLAQRFRKLDLQEANKSNLVESFDISGKVDTENPIYKFYNKEVRKYLVNKYGAKEITDPQGVKWIEVDIKPEMKKLPIEAFGVVPLLSEQKDDKKT